MFSLPQGAYAAACGLIYLAVVAVPLAITDARLRRLPNRLVLPGGAVALLGQIIACAAFAGDGWRLLVAVGLAVGLFVVGLWMASFGALGMGDVKLLAVLALAIGWFSVWALALVVLAGFVLSFGHAAVQRRSSSRGIPLGTHLMAGYLASCLAWIVFAWRFA